MEFHFDERFARAVAAVDSRHATCQGVQQLRQFIQATFQIRQIHVVGVFDTDRLTTAVVMHYSVINPAGQTPESLTKTAKFAHQRQFVPLAQLRAIGDPELAKLVGRDFANTMKLAHRQTTDKFFDLIRCDHE
ncbi:hypothetical protein D3C84_660240 [compost metagenome]